MLEVWFRDSNVPKRRADEESRSSSSMIEISLRDHVERHGGKPAGKRSDPLIQIFATQDTASKIGSGIGALTAIGVHLPHGVSRPGSVHQQQ